MGHKSLTGAGAPVGSFVESGTHRQHIHTHTTPGRAAVMLLEMSSEPASLRSLPDRNFGNVIES